MSADVLMTLAGRDLDPRDLIADTERSTDLIAQQVDVLLSIAEGEWPTNPLLGIDWIGYMTDRSVNMSALCSDVARVIGEQPNTVVESVTGQHVGRLVTIQVTGYLSQRPFRVAILSGQDAAQASKVGSNGLYAPLVLQWGFSPI